MSCKSAIYTVNQTNQAVDTDAGTFVQVPFGSVIRRFGPNVALDGGGIVCCGSGYFDVDCSITYTPTEAGPITAQIRQDGVPVQGMTATVTGAAGSPIGIDIPNGLVRNCGRCCNSVLTLWIDAPGNITNVGTKVETE